MLACLISIRRLQFNCIVYYLLLLIIYMTISLQTRSLSTLIFSVFFLFFLA
ncbi:hypothetical protein WN944_000147 [Citrus x changshan-huyou]|uniref:Uncharacterized protein n=1 Tax=Citrus x changshan-huyou TaxID=2935761 RepID=A0AAP0ME03_9ROSI